MTSLNLIPQQFNVRINPSKSCASRELDNSRRGEPNLPEGGELGEAGTDDSASRSSTWSLTLSSTPVFLSLRPLRFYQRYSAWACMPLVAGRMPATKGMQGQAGRRVRGMPIPQLVTSDASSR